MFLLTLVATGVSQGQTTYAPPPSMTTTVSADFAPAPYAVLADAVPYPTTSSSAVPVSFLSATPASGPDGPAVTTSAATEVPWIAAPPAGPVYHAPEVFVHADPALAGRLVQPEYWHWQLLPDGLIYRSYQAGPREPRISTVFFSERDGRTLWDPILGGRMPIIRFGNDNVLQPNGWQLDIEGAALVRLNLDANRDVESSDFRFGVPVSYGIDNWQFKFGYYHLSSHLGDEFMVRNATLVRINYVRDAVLLGFSYNPIPSVRLYAETAYAFFTAGGAEPWEFQFGMEWAKAGPTGGFGTPFLAINAHLREELNFGGDLTVQTGWLWRGNSGHVLRTGLHYMNGKSTQYQFLMDSEQQIGWGLWYDF